MRGLSTRLVDRVALRARALGDPTRVRILSALGAGDLTVSAIAHAIATGHSTVSKHLQVLFNAGLVNRHREASAVVYSVASVDVAECIRLLARIAGERAPRA